MYRTSLPQPRMTLYRSRTCWPCDILSEYISHAWNKENTRIFWHKILKSKYIFTTLPSKTVSRQHIFLWNNSLYIKVSVYLGNISWSTNFPIFFLKSYIYELKTIWAKDYKQNDILNQVHAPESHFSLIIIKWYKIETRVLQSTGQPFTFSVQNDHWPMVHSFKYKLVQCLAL